MPISQEAVSAYLTAPRSARDKDCFERRLPALLRLRSVTSRPWSLALQGLDQHAHSFLSPAPAAEQERGRDGEDEAERARERTRVRKREKETLNLRERAARERESTERSDRDAPEMRQMHTQKGTDTYALRSAESCGRAARGHCVSESTGPAAVCATAAPAMENT